MYFEKSYDLFRDVTTCSSVYKKAKNDVSFLDEDFFSGKLSSVFVLLK